jgi:hypothetical protein
MKETELDLDALLASFNDAAKDATAKRPLIEVASYLSPEQLSSQLYRARARRFVAYYLAWVAECDQLADVGKRTRLQSYSGDLVEAASVSLEQDFGDSLLEGDFAAAVQPFCLQYLAPASGSYADDFHQLFVEGRDAGSFLDVLLSHDDVNRLFAHLDARLASFVAGRQDWQEPIKSNEPMTDRWIGDQSFSAWQLELRSFDLAEHLPAGRYRKAIHAYLKTVDLAGRFPPEKSADELVRTYLHHSDSSVQSNVWRVLRSLPPLSVFKSLLSHVNELSATRWAKELIGIFEADLDRATFDQMISLLDGAPRSSRLAYLTALHSAERDGNEYARTLLQAMFPSESSED